MAPSLALLMSGCGDGQLYPVQGPLSAQKPRPVYKVKIGDDEKMSATRAKDDVCHGPWAHVAQEDPTARAMSAEWDLVYGKGYFLDKVLGSATFSRGVLTCPKDTTINVEFNIDKGVAKDDKGDVFKLTF
jgi:hypothetical protein